jgi:hypothetical protein
MMTVRCNELPLTVLSPRSAGDRPSGLKPTFLLVLGDTAEAVPFPSYSRQLVNIELLLMHRGIALHDDGALGQLFHLV